MNQHPRENQNFMDSKTLLAIVLSGVLFMGWNSYLKNKYNMDQPKTAVEKSAVNSDESTVSQDNDDAAVSSETAVTNGGQDATAAATVVETSHAETLISFEDEYWSFDISSKGMGVKNLRLKKYYNRDKEPKEIGTDHGLLPFATTLTGRSKPLDFDLKKVGDLAYVGTAEVLGNIITKTITIDSKTYSFDTKISVSTPNENFIGVKTYMAEPLKDTSGGGFLDLNRFDIQSFFISYGSSEDIEVINKEEPQVNSYTSVASVSVGEQYFAQAFVDKSDVLPDAKTQVDTKSNTALAMIDYPLINKNKDFNIAYVAYMGPKSLDLLDSVNETLTSIIDFGFFSFIAKPLLHLLHWFHDMIGNWGFAIILMTLVVRLLVFPLHMSSFKSMKNMSKLSPLIKEINEKYKDDPQTKNIKLMEVYKENKINPIGGCLPMLLQLPVFFALYQVLGQSIELYQAPFIFWIEDLSLKDPYYVLPVLMGITMFLQMRLTPSTMDEMQKKVMSFMPIMFTVFMLSLPSGLTLYIFISGLFGIIQQYMIKDRNDAASATAK